MPNEYVPKAFAGAAVASALSANMSSAASSFSVVDASTFPTGIDGPFVVSVGLGLASEEKVLCSTRSGNTFDVLERGYDGTTAQAHSSTHPVAHVLDANTIRQAHRLATAMTATGDMAYRTGDGTYGRIAAAATEGHQLVNVGGVPTWDEHYLPFCELHDHPGLGATAFPANTYSKAVFTTETRDLAGLHSSASPGRIIVDRTGLWMFDFSLYLIVTGTYTVAPVINGVLGSTGSGNVNVTVPSSSTGWASGSGMLYLTAGDYVEIFFAPTTNRQVEDSAGNRSRFAMAYLGKQVAS